MHTRILWIAILAMALASTVLATGWNRDITFQSGDPVGDDLGIQGIHDGEGMPYYYYSSVVWWTWNGHRHTGLPESGGPRGR